MKIIPGKYPECTDWQTWIGFTKGPEISRVFLYRLAAYVRDVVKKKVTTYGYRSYTDQVAAYNDYLAGGNIAAKPGTSWHGYGLAVDFNRVATVGGKGVYPGTLNADYDLFMAGKAETLHKYGLTHTVKTEPWHVQPIETKGYSGDRASFVDSDDKFNTASGYLLEGDDMIFCKRGEGTISNPDTEVLIFQQCLSDLGIEMKNSEGKIGTADGSYGGCTVGGVNAFESKYGLAKTNGEAVTEVHLRALIDTLRHRSTGISQAELDAVKAELASANEAINQGASIASQQAQIISGLQSDIRTAAQHLQWLSDFKNKAI